MYAYHPLSFHQNQDLSRSLLDQDRWLFVQMVHLHIQRPVADLVATKELRNLSSTKKNRIESMNWLTADMHKWIMN